MSLTLLALSWVSVGEGASLSAQQAVPASRQADRVAVITIRGQMDAVTASSVERRMALAIDRGAQAIVFDIDTPGGEIGAVLEICAAIKSSAVPNTVAWINPQAYSGGAIMALACREIVVNDSASFGDALPIAIGLGGAQAATQGELRKKIVPPVLSEVVDSARIRGWDEFIVQAIVIDGVELWWVEESDPADGPPRRFAVNEQEFGLLFPGVDPPRGSPLIVSASPNAVPAPAELSQAEDAPAATEDPAAFRPASPTLRDLSPALTGESEAESARDLDMLTAASDRPVFTSDDAGGWQLGGYLTNGSGPIVMKTREMERFGFSSGVIRNDEELRAFFGATTLDRLDRSWTESTVRALSTFWVRGILIVVFVLALFLEMTSPGLVLPGVTAFAALVLLMAPAWMLGLAGWWEAIAIVLGVACLLAEIFVLPGFGVFGVAGFLLLFGGLVGSFLGPSATAPGSGNSELIRAFVTVILAMVTSGVGIGVIMKQFGRLPVLRGMVLDASRVGDDDAGDELVAAMRDDDELASLIGRTGRAHTALLPSGRVEIDDRLHDAKSGLGSIDQGDAVVVVRTDGWQLVVEAVADDGSGPPSPPAGGVA